MLAITEGPRRRGMKILLVDDHVLIREALRGVLNELKGEATVVEASDWSQAIREIDQDADVDLILLDLTLPDRDGFEILAELRERYPAISVVVLSAQHDDGQRCKSPRSRGGWLHSEVGAARSDAQRVQSHFLGRHVHPARNSCPPGTGTSAISGGTRAVWSASLGRRSRSDRKADGSAY